MKLLSELSLSSLTMQLILTPLPHRALPALVFVLHALAARQHIKPFDMYRIEIDVCSWGGKKQLCMCVTLPLSRDGGEKCWCCVNDQLCNIPLDLCH